MENNMCFTEKMGNKKLHHDEVKQTCDERKFSDNRNQNSSSCDSGINTTFEGNIEEGCENNVKEVQLAMKSLVNTDDGSDLSQISPVLTCIRTLNESGFILDEERSKCVKSLCLSKLKHEEEISRKDGFLFAVSLRDGACLYTSEAITDHLGYPKDMLVGQCFMNFIYDKDHLTFANHLTQGLNVCFTQGKRDDSHLVLNTFFCRIREYHGLKFGYSVADTKPQYKPFKIILHINELVLDDICVEKPLATLCVKATATQVSSAYSVPKEIPAMTSFSTRHTASCHFSHVDASAIPYLGFLPQDMIGYSVFDFYHIDDMPQLKEIYELVIKEHGTSFRSKPYRFKVHNGCYIMLETEWSCFINPWSHKLEFVVGQHRVLKGPSDISIFTPCEISETNASDEITKESQAIQKEIKVILSQSLENFQFKKNKRLCNKRKRDLVSFVYSCIDKGNANGDKEAMDDRGSHSDPDSVVMGDISPYREMNDSSVSSPTVQQMRYQENIERFFASQPKTYSDGSDDFKNDKSSSVEEYQGSSSGSGNGSGSGSGNGSGNASKETQSASPNYDQKIQESGSNSSKGNMSSSITGDSGYGKSWEKSCTNDPDSNQAGPSKSTRMKNSCEINDNNITFASCLSLTEETLSAHNKFNTKQIKQQRKTSSGVHKTAIKENRVQQSDVGHSKNKKNNRNLNLTTQANTPTPVTVHAGFKCTAPKLDQSNQENLSTCVTNTTHSCIHHPHNTCSASGPIPTPFFIPVYMGSVSCFPPTVNPFWAYAPTPNDENQVGNLPLNPVINFPLNPCFPFPTVPSYIGNPSCNHLVRSSGVTTTSHLSTTTTTVASGTSTTFKNTVAGKEYSAYKKKTGEKVKVDQPRKQDSEGIESDMQIDESVSSFTKSSSQQSQDKDEEMDLDLKKFYTASNSDKIELNSEIAYRYQMDTSNVNEILKKDREILKTMQQPDLVNKQLQMLQEEINDENESKPKTEDDFCITEEIMLGLTTEDAVTEAASIAKVGPSSSLME